MEKHPSAVDFDGYSNVNIKSNIIHANESAVLKLSAHLFTFIPQLMAKAQLARRFENQTFPLHVRTAVFKPAIISTPYALLSPSAQLLQRYILADVKHRSLVHFCLGEFTKVPYFTFR